MKKGCFVLIFLLLAIRCHADTIIVDASGTGDYPTIQVAINNSNNGDIIELQLGTYTGNGNRDIDFMDKAITVCSTDPNDPNTVADTIIDCDGSGRGFYFHRGENVNSILDGLTVTDGSAWNEDGGGILCEYSSPTIRNCIITNNSAEIHMIAGGSGGGIYCAGSDARIIKCTITNNRSDFDGGGIAIIGGAPNVSDCIFNNNVAGSYGGSISCQYDHAVITNCAINDNNAGIKGGGVHLGQSCDALMDKCIIKENTNDGILCEESSPIIHNCLIEYNSGYGIYCSDHGDLLITNCTIARNYFGGGIYCYWSDPTITNSILWANSATFYGPQIALRTTGWPSTLTVSFSNVEGGQEEAYVESGCTLNWGPGNIDADPCFADASSGDYHLQSEAGRWDPNGEIWVTDGNTSPCIDAGNPGCPLGEEPNDPNNVRINMGAYSGTAEASKTPADWYSIADLTNDKKVDFNDLGIFFQYWLDSGECIPSDLNRNKFIDFNDYNIFSKNWP